MEQESKIMPLLWRILDKNKKCSINITNKDSELCVSILRGNRWRRFKNQNPQLLEAAISNAFYGSF